MAWSLNKQFKLNLTCFECFTSGFKPTTKFFFCLLKMSKRIMLKHENDFVFVYALKEIHTLITMM